MISTDSAGRKKRQCKDKGEKSFRVLEKPVGVLKYIFHK